jgi:2-amino-4-hydroxy-6-hydroxymethyldihydropteridine diphosphokinase
MRAFVGLGSNLGEREALIGQAVDELAALPDTTLIRVSSLYDTEPVGVIEQPRFLNAVAMLDTELTARQLLWNLQRIEARLGRTRSQRWGPRTMDLDLLLYGDLVIGKTTFACRIPSWRGAPSCWCRWSSSTPSSPIR